MDVNELESKKQQIYELQREISRLTALERDYISEIELLHAGQNEEAKKLELKIQQLEKDIVLIKSNKKEHVDSLENEVSEKNKEIEKLTTELKAIAKLADSANLDNTKYDALLLENSTLKEENTVLEHLSLEIKNNFDVTTKYNSKLEAKIQNLQEELDGMRENCTLKNEKLQEANSLIESLKEDLIVMQSQLDIAKSKPLDDLCRGNSLFAEVDDRRVKLQSNMSQMKDHYLEMKRKHVALLDQVSFLKKENLTLKERWHEISNLQDITDNETISMYKNRIESLEGLVSKYQKMVDEKPATTENDPINVFTFEKAIAVKDKEITDYMKKVEDLSSMKTLLSFKLRTSNKDLQDSKLQLTKLECDMAELKVEMENLKMNKPELVKKEAAKPCTECAKRKTPFANLVKSKPKPRPIQNKVVEYDLNILMQKTEKNVGTKIKEEKVAGSKNEKSVNFKAEKLNKIKEESINTKGLFGENDTNTLDESKENDIFNIKASAFQEKKNVKFTDDTFTPKGDNKSYRRKGKIISCPLTIIPKCE